MRYYIYVQHNLVVLDCLYLVFLHSVTFAFCRICIFVKIALCLIFILLQLHYTIIVFCYNCILSGLHFVTFSFCRVCILLHLHFIKFALCYGFSQWIRQYSHRKTWVCLLLGMSFGLRPRNIPQGS